MVICLERGADLHTTKLMPLPLTVSCFSKIQIFFTFLVPAHLGSPGKRAVKRVCVRCCCCYLSEARCRLFAYGPADATAIPKPHHLLLHSNPDWFYFFWYRLNQVVLEKRPLNGCNSSSMCKKIIGILQFSWLLGLKALPLDHLGAYHAACSTA